MRSSRRKLNKKSILTALIIVSAVGIMLPDRITGSLISLVQVIVPFQDWTTRGTQAATDALAGSPDTVPSPEKLAALQRENEYLRHRLASASVQYNELAEQHRAVAGIRRRGLTNGRLVPARVVAGDVLAWRESRLINAGTLKGVKRSSAVASHYFTIELDEQDAAQPGLSVLAGEALVGFIDQVGTHSARVRLLTDRDTKMSPLIARYSDGKYYPLDKEFWMVGTGGRLLQIRDVDHRYIKTGAIKEGDIVLSGGTDRRLPAPMTIGTVKKIHTDPDNSLLYILDVEPAIDPSEIRKVLVVDVAA